MPILPPWKNDLNVAHLQAKAVPMNFIWSESALWLLSSSVRKILEALLQIPGALIMFIGMPIIPQWANDHISTGWEWDGGQLALVGLFYWPDLVVQGQQKF